MKRYLVIFVSVGSLFLAGCANDLTVEDTSNRPPAPYSPDPASHLPAPSTPTLNPYGNRY